MTKDTFTGPVGHPIDVIDDPLTEVLRSGAQRLLETRKLFKKAWAEDGMELDLLKL